MLTDKQIMPTCYYWAGRFYRWTKLPYDELLSEAYIAARKLDNPKYLQKAVMHHLLSFLKKEKRYKEHVVNDIAVLNSDNEELFVTNIKPEEHDFLQAVEVKDMLEYIMNNVDFSSTNNKSRNANNWMKGYEANVIFMRFYKGMDYEEIAKHFGVHPSTVGYQINRILRKIRETIKESQDECRREV